MNSDRDGSDSTRLALQRSSSPKHIRSLHGVLALSHGHYLEVHPPDLQGAPILWLGTRWSYLTQVGRQLSPGAPKHTQVSLRKANNLHVACLKRTKA